MIITNPPVLPFLTFACDESSQTTDDFMVVGGIACASKREYEITQDLKQLKGEKFAASEVKWSKTRNGERLALHKRVVDHVFEKIGINQFHFHGLIVPFSDFDHGLREGCNKSDSVTKMLYQLCLHRPVRYYGKVCAIHIKPDHSDAYLGFKYYGDALNNDAKKKYSITTRPVREITFPDSARSAVHQMNDLIIGALAHRKNGRHLVEGASAHKCELANYVHEKIEAVKIPRTCTIWNFTSPHLKTTKPPT
jgi:hypothetical protein